MPGLSIELISFFIYLLEEYKRLMLEKTFIADLRMYLFALHTITHLGYKERTKLILNPSQ